VVVDTAVETSEIDARVAGVAELVTVVGEGVTVADDDDSVKSSVLWVVVTVDGVFMEDNEPAVADVKTVVGVFIEDNEPVVAEVKTVVGVFVEDNEPAVAEVKTIVGVFFTEEDGPENSFVVWIVTTGFENIVTVGGVLTEDAEPLRVVTTGFEDAVSDDDVVKTVVGVDLNIVWVVVADAVLVFPVPDCGVSRDSVIREIGVVQSTKGRPEYNNSPYWILHITFLCPGVAHHTWKILQLSVSQYFC